MTATFTSADWLIVAAGLAIMVWSSRSRGDQARGGDGGNGYVYGNEKETTEGNRGSSAESVGQI